MSDALAGARARIRSGVYLPRLATTVSKRVVVVARDHDDAQIVALAEAIADIQLVRTTFRPIFLVGQVDTQPLSRFGFQFETAMDAGMLERCNPGVSMDDYWRARVEEMLAVYGPHSTLHLEPGRPVAAWMLP